MDGDAATYSTTDSGEYGVEEAILIHPNLVGLLNTPASLGNDEVWERMGDLMEDQR